MLKTCLNSVTFIVRQSRMSGISKQQLLRKHIGIVVQHDVFSGGYQVNVTQHGKLIYKQPDDCFATGSQFVLDLIWRDYNDHWRPLFEPDATPVYSFINGFNVDQILNAFDFNTFNEQILPRLEMEESLKKHVITYKTFVGDMSARGRYLLYDVLVRIFLYLRYHHIDIKYVDLKKVRPVPVMEGLIKIGETDYFLMDQGDIVNNTLLSTLKLFYPEGKIEEIDQNLVFVANPHFDIFSVAGGKKIEPLDKIPFEKDTAIKGAEIQDEVDFQVLPMDDQLVESLAPQLYSVILKPFQNLSAEERDFINYGENVGVIGKDGIGLNALRGAGKVCGEGSLQECVARLFNWLRNKAPARFSDEDVMRTVFGRLARMQSAKTVYRQGGTYKVKNLN